MARRSPPRTLMKHATSLRYLEAMAAARLKGETGHTAAATVGQDVVGRNIGIWLRMPPRNSSALIARMQFHHGTVFHIAVTRRSSPAFCMKWKVASAVGSSLSREMKPEPGLSRLRSIDVIGPGFSNKNSTCARSPPSIGSKIRDLTVPHGTQGLSIACEFPTMRACQERPAIRYAAAPRYALGPIGLASLLMIS